MLLTHSIISVDLNNFGVLTVHNTSLLPVHAIVYTAVLYFCFIMKKPVLVVAVLEWLLDEDRVCIGESTELSYLLDQRLMSDVLRETEREKYRQMSQTQLMISSSPEPVLRDQEQAKLMIELSHTTQHSVCVCVYVCIMGRVQG